nr:hypothetical protein [Tanacetum cinerariifolium]
KEGLRACMVMFDQKGREYSHAICLNFHASKDDMDYEALLAGLVAFAERGMKDLDVLVDSRFLVDQVKGNRITYLPKALNPKAEALIGMASIRLDFSNQEVSVGVKTRPLVEAQDMLPEKTKSPSKKAALGNSSPTLEDHIGSN